MDPLVIEHVAKTFAQTVAVRDVSFRVGAGEIFALLGPNGAGKTTTIRMALDIFQPDQGTIHLFGAPPGNQVRDRIGYLPEERGLYRNLNLVECLVYLAELKGLAPSTARHRLTGWLERFDLAAHSHKRINDLSRGMQQKAQFIAALIHEPDLLIVDEPFAALDPVNTRLIKDILREWAAQGRTVIMSTHQMHLVEELAERMVMINRGEVVLYGTVAAVRQQFAANALVIHGQGQLGPLPGVAAVDAQREPGSYLLRLEDDVAPQQVLRALVAQSAYTIERFAVALPTLDEIFVRVVAGEQPQEVLA
ncbi:MAG: ATP-binding cassette domain-containing protein [Candidatus Viridilinea halotolerans]|uniref:ATP-binding cassette domain-containing protein n=1 Tax=Candidatus Viridilinea halotolerans TaxID=2491704 RepID=A0A426TQE7_9CHLR|nr:MAG: ATP-binding cassette domain-containing protein [Candidatus Viridilinea halotolerans]